MLKNCMLEILVSSYISFRCSATDKQAEAVFDKVYANLLLMSYCK